MYLFSFIVTNDEIIKGIRYEMRDKEYKKEADKRGSEYVNDGRPSITPTGMAAELNPRMDY